MTRTTIVLPASLKKRSVDKARAEGISFAEFVRNAVELSVKIFFGLTLLHAFGDGFRQHVFGSAF